MSALFATLPESRRSRRRSPAAGAVSVVLHAAVITFALVATAKGNVIVDSDEQVGIVWHPPVPPLPPTTGERQSSGPGTTARRTIVDDALPDPMPPISLPTLDGPDIPDDVPPIGPVGERWGRGSGAAGGMSGDDTGGPGAGDVHTGPQVERAAALLGAVSPRYPAMLRERGIEGSVTLRFVVDTAGRVEPASVTVVSSTHELFAAAARAALPALRFTPAAAGGRRVRQLVELPFAFEIR